MSAKSKSKTTAKALPAVRLDVHPNVIIASEEFSGVRLFQHVVMPDNFQGEDLTAHHVAAFKAAGRKVKVNRYDSAGNLLK